MLTTLLVALAIVLALLVAIIGLLWWRQERIVFQPPRSFPDMVEDDVARVDHRASDGQPLFAYVVDPPGSYGRAIEGTVLAFHGNADLAAWLVPWAREVARRTGWRVVLPEYRGYAGLPGAPTYAYSRLDAAAAYAAARETLGAEPSRLALYGHSLGSAIAAELAARSPHSALVLEAPFTSARDMARRIAFAPAVLAWPLISRVHFDTSARVAGLETPVSVAHGQRDVIIPAGMGRRVHGAARVPGALLEVPGAGHNDVARVGGEAYWRWLAGALAGARD
jgi:fermentation-respiration switch protein FrsA (DUF1100 family)